MPRRPSWIDREPESDLVGRVRQIVAEKWDGNSRAAGRVLAVDPTLILRVVRDGQDPPARLLLALVERGRIDPGWLMRGAVSSENLSVPLLDRLLPGPLTEYRPALWVPRQPVPVSRDLYADSVYAYRLTQADPLRRLRDWQAFEGDYLYINSHPLALTSIGYLHLQTPCLVVWRWLGDGSDPAGKPPVMTGWGDISPDGGRCRARLFKQKRAVGFEYDVELGSPGGEPLPLPVPGGRLGCCHVAGVVIERRGILATPAWSAL